MPTLTRLAMSVLLSRSVAPSLDCHSRLVVVLVAADVVVRPKVVVATFKAAVVALLAVAVVEQTHQEVVVALLRLRSDRLTPKRQVSIKMCSLARLGKRQEDTDKD